MAELAVQFALEMISEFVPFAVVFGLSSLAVRIFLKAAFKGRIEI